MRNLWIIEKRTPDGALDFTAPQPESIFGLGAISGMTDWAISRVVYARKPDAVMSGDSIARWPSLIDPAFVARRKTW